MSRHVAREKALQALYQIDVSRNDTQGAIQSVMNHVLDEETIASDMDISFVEQLVYGTLEHLDSTDQKLHPYLKDWRMERLSVVDRSILRMAVYEIYHLKTPASVVMDESIELARRFSSEESRKFVNGILSAVVKADEPPGVYPTDGLS